MRVNEVLKKIGFGLDFFISMGIKINTLYQINGEV